MKKLLILIIPILLLTGCGKVESINEYDTSAMGLATCTRSVKQTGVKAKLNYKLYYVGNILKILESTESISSSDSDTLDEYETSYKKLSKDYDGLEYYTQKVSRSGDTVTNQIVINYGEIDMDKLIKIEGNDEGVYVDGKVPLDKWISFAEKYGTECTYK